MDNNHRLGVVTWTLYALTLASALPIAAIIAAASPQPDDACSGIGLGCSLYGYDAASFMLGLVGIPYALVLGVLLAIATVLGPRARPVAVGLAVVGLLVPWVAALAVASNPAT